MNRNNDRVLDRSILAGRGEEILILVAARSTAAQLTDWLKLPIELSPNEGLFLLELNQCCQVRRKGEELLKFVMARASDEQWCKWLQIPLEHALATGKTMLVKPLLQAGAGIVRAVWRESTVVSEETDAAYSAASSSCGTARCIPVDQAASAAAIATGLSPSCCLGAPVPQMSRKPPSSSCMKRSPSTPLSGVAAAPACTPSPVAVTVTRCRAVSKGGGASPTRCPSAFDGTSKRCALSKCGGGGGNVELAVPSPAPFLPDDKLCLHQATKDRDSVRMRELLAAGVDRHATDLWGCTALHRAAEKDGCAEPVRILLAAGLDVRARDMEGYTPLHFAAARVAETATVDFIAAGACVADRGNNGDTPLHSAARFLSLPTVRILVEADADETAQNDDGDTPKDVTGVLPDGRDIEGQTDPLVAQRIVALLTKAPRQRRWRRRGWLIMLQARAQAEAARELAEADRTQCLTVVQREDANAATQDCGESGDGGGGGCDDEGGGGVRAFDGDEGDVLKGVCGGGDASPLGKNGGFKQLVEKTTMLPEPGLFQNVLRYL